MIKVTDLTIAKLFGLFFLLTGVVIGCNTQQPVELPIIEATTTESLTPTPDLTATPSNSPTPSHTATPNIVVLSDEQDPSYQPLNIVSGFEGFGPQQDFPAEGDPKDFDIAVGLERIIAMANYGIGLYNKQGELLDFLLLDEFIEPFWLSIHPETDWASAEVRSLYDTDSQRFFLNAMALAEFPDTLTTCIPERCLTYVFLAVSKSSNPQSLGPEDWHFYGVDSKELGDDGLSRQGDHTIISVSKDVVAITYKFNLEYYIQGNYQRDTAKLFFFPKQDLINGVMPDKFTSMWRMEDPFIAGLVMDQIMPVIPLDEDTGDMYFLYQSGHTCSLALMKVGDPLGDQEVELKILQVNQTCYQPNESSPQAGEFRTGVTYTSQLASRPVMRNGSIWGVQVLSGNDMFDGLSAIRWYEIDTSSGISNSFIAQEGRITHTDLSAVFPVLTVDPDNNVQLFYGLLGGKMYQSLLISGRTANDPPGLMRPSVIAVLGQSGYEPISEEEPFLMLGDYFGAALDPVDNSAWTFGRYANTPCRFATWITNADWSFDQTDFQIYSPNELFRPPRDCDYAITGTIANSIINGKSELLISACRHPDGPCEGFPVTWQAEYFIFVPPGEYTLHLNSWTDTYGSYTSSESMELGICPEIIIVEEDSNHVIHIETGMIVECE